MPVNRFYSLNDTLEGDEFTHLTRVLRKNVGAHIEVINGRGSLSQAEVISIERHIAHLRLYATVETAPPSPRFSLIQGIPEGSKIEFILEKCTELGIDDFHFFGPRTFSAAKLTRFHHLLIAALKQSGRLFLPTLSFHSRLEDIPLHAHLAWGDFEGGKAFPCTQFAIGPEGGFTEEEKAYLKKQGRGVSLSENILRTETAAIIAAHLLKHIP